MTRVLAEFMPTGEPTVEWDLHRQRAISGGLMFLEPLASL